MMNAPCSANRCCLNYSGLLPRLREEMCSRSSIFSRSLRLRVGSGTMLHSSGKNVLAAALSRPRFAHRAGLPRSEPGADHIRSKFCRDRGRKFTACPGPRSRLKIRMPQSRNKDLKSKLVEQVYAQLCAPVKTRDDPLRLFVHTRSDRGERKFDVKR